MKTIFFIFSICYSYNLMAEIFKCTDENENISYQQFECEHDTINTEVMKVKNSNPIQPSHNKKYNSFNSSQLVGSWCYSELESDRDGATIRLKTDATYETSDSYEKRQGTWKVQKDILHMSGLDPHTLISVNSEKVLMKKIGSTQRVMIKGACK